MLTAFLTWLGSLISGIIGSVINDSLDTPAETTNIKTTGTLTVPATPVDQVLEKYKWLL